MRIDHTTFKNISLYISIESEIKREIFACCERRKKPKGISHIEIARIHRKVVSNFKAVHSPW